MDSELMGWTAEPALIGWKVIALIMSMPKLPITQLKLGDAYMRR